jgi:hypothetical protein
MLTLLSHRTWIYINPHQTERTPKKLLERKNGNDYVTPPPALVSWGVYTVKNAVELFSHSILMLKKYNITDELFLLSSHVFFLLPC